MNEIKRVGFCAFGEVNTPYYKLQEKHDEALKALAADDYVITDAGIVVDDVRYEAADAAIAKLKTADMDVLVVCICGWIPTHAVIRVTDEFRHLPVLLWGLCGWKENGRIFTTTEQAGTTALRPALEDLGYRFKYVHNVIGEPWPMERIRCFITAAHAARELRHLRVGTMGYRDMLLYGTQFEGCSMRGQIGVEVEPFEMLEMVQLVDTVEKEAIADGIRFVKENWDFERPCDDSVIETGVKYALALGKKIEMRKYDAISLIDVDGFKKLLGFPPAMVFMLLDHWYHIETTPENDIMGNVTQLMVRLLTGETAAYLEYYEIFKDSVFIGVPDYVPEYITDGRPLVVPAAFGLFNSALLNVSKVKTGKLTLARLFYRKGKYYMHVYTGTGKTPPHWAEFGWDDPAPQPPSLEVVLDCPMEEFEQKVSSQHVIISYGDNVAKIKDLCYLLGIEVI